MQYAWLIWSLILLVVWLVVYLSLKNGESKKEMLIVSSWTSFFGLTEPFFVPEYWLPPSLFDLALKTGFDIESLIFSFGIGGLAAVIYERLFRTKHKAFSERETRESRHKYHFLGIVLAPVVFALLFVYTGLNPIYSVTIAMILGGLAAWYCRPDLRNKMLASAVVFLALYFLYFLILAALFQGYVERVWNLAAISGILLFGVPLEELMFAFSFGFLWSSVYEHIKWYKIRTE